MATEEEKIGLSYLHQEPLHVMEWISVEDEKSPAMDYVLVFEKKFGTNEPSPISIARWTRHKYQCLFEDRAAYMDLTWEIEVENITHWMPLPEPPGYKETI